MLIDNSTLQHKLSNMYRQNYTWLRKKTLCEHNSADIAQDTFVRELTSKNTLNNVREARAYLTNLNLVKEIFNKLKYQQKLFYESLA
ncbi:hypothetical protein GCM10009111_18980 [Colwellia asteriadis]|uniref:Uncharacterized protein n=1 Tax=Colwellia asteriadis TaxID=517723 RepID=A0ABP3WGB6_9GAMM